MRNDSFTRKPAIEPLDTVQVPSGEVVLVVAVLSCGNCNGGAVGPANNPGKIRSAAIAMTQIATMPMTIHMNIFILLCF
jgi:hypothetical protein